MEEEAHPHPGFVQEALANFNPGEELNALAAAAFVVYDGQAAAAPGDGEAANAGDEEAADDPDDEEDDLLLP